MKFSLQLLIRLIMTVRGKLPPLERKQHRFLFERVVKDKVFTVIQQQASTLRVYLHMYIYIYIYIVCSGPYYINQRKLSAHWLNILQMLTKKLPFS